MEIYRRLGCVDKIRNAGLPPDLVKRGCQGLPGDPELAGCRSIGLETRGHSRGRGGAGGAECESKSEFHKVWLRLKVILNQHTARAYQMQILPEPPAERLLNGDRC